MDGRRQGRGVVVGLNFILAVALAWCGLWSCSNLMSRPGEGGRAREGCRWVQQFSNGVPAKCTPLKRTPGACCPLAPWRLSVLFVDSLVFSLVAKI